MERNLREIIFHSDFGCLWKFIIFFPMNFSLFMECYEGPRNWMMKLDVFVSAREGVDYFTFPSTRITDSLLSFLCFRWVSSPVSWGTERLFAASWWVKAKSFVRIPRQGIETHGWLRVNRGHVNHHKHDPSSFTLSKKKIPYLMTRPL